MTDGSGSNDAPKAGYKNPPTSGQFRKGQSGNPKGRPKGRHRAPPKEEILGRKIMIRDAAGPRKVTAEMAFLYRIQELALKGNSSAVRAFEELKALVDHTQNAARASPDGFHIHFVSPGSVNAALEILNMARVRDRYRAERANVVLEPWLVEAALARLGTRQLTLEEQEEVWAATRTPSKVIWPDWWQVRGKATDD